MSEANYKNMDVKLKVKCYLYDEPITKLIIGWWIGWGIIKKKESFSENLYINVSSGSSDLFKLNKFKI